MIPTPLITAAESYPALEQLCAEAREDLFLSFRIFDPGTRLHSGPLKERGLEDWADLIAWVTRRGVRLRLLQADFDPLMASGLHRQAWANASGFADVVQGDAQILVAPHGQTAGPARRVPMVHKLRAATRALRAEDRTALTPVQRRVLQSGIELRPATLHQTFAVADRRAAIIGGLDVDRRRFDSRPDDRPPRDIWHDVSLLTKDADFVGALAGHFEECWNAALPCAASLANPAVEMDSRVKPQSRADLRLIRSFATPGTGLARLAPTARQREHETALTRLFSEARDYLYIETHCLRHAPLTDALCEAAGKSPDLQLILLLPQTPEPALLGGVDGWDARRAHGLQTAALLRLQAVFDSRLALVTPAQRRAAPDGAPRIEGAGLIHVHSTVVIADDLVAIVGSANLNGRSLRWDTEASALVRDKVFARGLLDRLASKWLGRSPGDPRRADSWLSAAVENAQRAPADREGFVLPYPMARADRFSRRLPRLPGLPDDMF